MPNALPFRQIHLDFHTSEACTSLGQRFNAEDFAATLQAAHVQSVNVFAKCHHGYSYYPTRAGTQHPGLAFDLLGQQIEALHRHGIRAPIYYSIMWDELAAREHPEWIAVDKNGQLVGRPPLSNAWGWATLDVASAYTDLVLAQVEELLTLYEVDGLWFDICRAQPNYAQWSVARMRQAGVRIEDEAAVWHYARQQLLHFCERVTTFIHQRRPECTIFYNNTVGRNVRETLPYQTQLEVESLPTGPFWPYLHYPMVARHVRSYGDPFVGMNGRFHTVWGDFGGIKTRDQFLYEIGTVLAAGGRISVGDQLHPNGQLDPAVYRLIGEAFGRVAQLEPWLVEAQPTAELAVLALEQGHGRDYGAEAEGAAQMLLELGYQFDVVDEGADFSRYGALILPNQPNLPAPLIEKLQAYLAQGGRLIMSGQAAYDTARDVFQLEGLPVTHVTPAPTVPAYFRVEASLTPHTEMADDYDYVFYEQAYQVQAAEDAQRLGSLSAALFSRTWDRFMGHQHAPVGDPLHTPLAVQSAQVLYLAAPVFSAYRNWDYWVYRVLVGQLLAAFMPPRLIETHAPAWVEFSLHTQAPARQFVHVVCYHARRTWQAIPHVDQGGMTTGVSVRLRREKAPDRVYLAPEGTPVAFTWEDGVVDIALPPLGVYTVLVVE
ncbi:MAG: hypothetical protein OHK0046_45710 [Anaerolineae bacterium]